LGIDGSVGSTAPLVHLALVQSERFVMNTGGSGPLREERLQIMVSREELTAIDNYRFEHRMPSRASAFRELLRRGLAAYAAPKKGGD
jgi:hypothetical protein